MSAQLQQRQKGVAAEGRQPPFNIPGERQQLMVPGQQLHCARGQQEMSTNRLPPPPPNINTRRHNLLLPLSDQCD